MTTEQEQAVDTCNTPSTCTDTSCCPPKEQPYKRFGAKIGRNDPCPCGTGKKFKKCCGRNA